MRVLGFDVRVFPMHDKARVQVQSRVLEKLDNARRYALGAARRFIPSTIVGSPAFQVRATDDGWMVAQRGSSLPLRVYAKKADAVREAKKMAKQYKVEVDIFTRQGHLQNSVSFSH